MARTVINETALPRDAEVNTAAVGVYQAADLTNGMVLADEAKSGTLVVHCKNTNAGAQTVTIKAGVGGSLGLAWRANLGDLVISLPATTGERMVFLTDTARFKQTDGSINVDPSISTSITIAAFRLAGH